jgi:TRAP-type C4-dicarboxylate transport system permease small subunit
MNAIDRIVSAFILKSCIWFLWIIFALVFYTVVARFAEMSSIAWMDDIIDLGMVWIVFMGSVLCLRSNEHVRADMVINFLKRKWPKVGKVLDVINTILILFFLFYLLKASWELVTKTLTTAWLPALPIVKSWWVTPILIASALMIAYTIVHLVNLLKNKTSQHGFVETNIRLATDEFKTNQ